MKFKLVVGPLLVLCLSLSLVAMASAQQQVTLAVNPVGGSGVSGTATLTEAGNATQVDLSFSGFEPNTSHATHFHVGTCAAPGSIVIDLPTLTADANGNASATATVNATLASLMDGNHLVQTHVAAPPNFGPGIACGDVPAAVATATPMATAAVTATPMATAAAVTATPVAVAATPTPAVVVAAAPAVTGGPEVLSVALALGGGGLFTLAGGLFLRRRR